MLNIALNMNETKVNLSITLRGNVMMSEQECSKNPRECYDYYKQSFKDKKGKKETIVFTTRKNRLIRQSINLTKEAYDYMSSDEVPEWYSSESPKKWKSLSKKERLEAHLKTMCESLGGESFTYQVFEE